MQGESIPFEPEAEYFDCSSFALDEAYSGLAAGHFAMSCLIPRVTSLPQVALRPYPFYERPAGPDDL